MREREILYVLYHPWITPTNFSKMFFFLLTEDIRILLFPVEHYTIKTDIFRYYLLPNSTALKLLTQNYMFQSKNKYTSYKYQFVLFITKLYGIEILKAKVWICCCPKISTFIYIYINVILFLIISVLWNLIIDKT